MVTENKWSRSFSSWPLYRQKYLGLLTPTIYLSLMGERASGPNHTFMLHLSRQFKNATTYSKKMSQKRGLLGTLST